MSRRILILIVGWSLGLSFTSIYGQSLTYISGLDEGVAESSGLIEIEGRLITHNDSGDGPYLYEINPLNGTIERNVWVQGVTAVDWEDLCHDENHIYVADIGNNDGNRTDLVIYKVSIAEYLSSDTVTAQTIEMTYADQLDFSPAPFETAFDAEAIISIDDSLYIFTKNWSSAESHIYPCPKSPGNYQLISVDSLDSQGFVTGATFSPLTGDVLLCGYTLSNAFVIKAEDFDPLATGAMDFERFEVSVPNSSYQIEAITDSGDGYLLSAESGFSGPASLQSLDLTTSLSEQSTQNRQSRLYPNPSDGLVNVSHPNLAWIDVYTQSGAHVITQIGDDIIDTSSLTPGSYVVELMNAQGSTIDRLQLVVE